MFKIFSQIVLYIFVFVGVGGRGVRGGGREGYCFPIRINGLEILDEWRNNISIKDESTD
jgi:hypothetical protein